MKMLRLLILSILFLTSLVAEDLDPAAQCEETYNTCLT